MGKLKFTVFLILPFMIVSSLAIAQKIEKVNIKGYVRDTKSGETLPYANITVKGRKYGTASNVNGYFVLVNMPVGPCTLLVHYIGYEAFELPLEAKKGMESLTIKMKQKIISGDEVIITAENLQTMEVSKTVSQLRISPREIAKLPAIAEVDIFRSLQLLPGISAVNDGNAGLYIRGGTPDQNLVLYDGMTIYNVDHFFGFISAFNAEAVKDVRVFKGGFPAKFGGRTSSVVELTGKSGSYDNFQAVGNASLLSGSGLLQFPIGGKGAWLISFRRSYTDFINSGIYDSIYNAVSGKNNGDDSEENTQTQQPLGPGGGRRGGPRQAPQQETFVPDFYYYDLNSKLTYSLTKNDILSFSLYNGRDNLDESQDLGQLNFRRPTAAGSDSSASASISDITQWGNTGFSGKWAKVWSDRLYSNFLVAYSSYKSESASGFSTTNANQNTIRRAFSSREENEVTDFTLRLENEYQLTSAHKFEFGFSRTKSDVFLNFTVNDTVNILDRDDEAAQTSFYFQDQWNVLKPLAITIGVRSTNYEPTKTTYWEPRASFSLNLNRNIALKGAWGQYHQFVNRIVNENVLEGNRDFWLLADEQLDPGYAEHRILGISYENPDYLFDVEAYHKDLDGVAEFSQRFRRGPNMDPEDLFFLGTGISQGIEFLAQKKSGRLSGWLSYTLAKVEYTLDVFNDGEPYPADQDRKHELKLVGNYGMGKWNLAATWVYASGAPFTSPEAQYSIALIDGNTRSYINVSDKNANRLPEYHRFDLSVTRKFSSETMNFNLGLSIFNLYNRGNVWYREYVLDTSPVIVRNVTTLGFTPTLTFRVAMK